MRQAVLFLMLACVCRAGSWEFSVGVFAGVSVADAATSWGQAEANPVLGCGRFGKRQMATKLSLDVGTILLERYIIRRHPEHKKALTITNYISSGMTAGAVIHNLTTK